MELSFTQWFPLKFTVNLHVTLPRPHTTGELRPCLSIRLSTAAGHVVSSLLWSFRELQIKKFANVAGWVLVWKLI